MEQARGAATAVVFGEALVDDFGDLQVVGGAPFNVARNLAGFGMPPLMVTRIGDDANGARMRSEFQRFGMSEAGLQVGAGEPTGRVQVERTGDGSHRFHILPDQAYDRVQPAPMLGALAGLAEPGPGPGAPSAVYFGTLAQRTAEGRAALRALLQACKAPRYLDLNLRDGQASEATVFDSLCHADTLKVNEEELVQLFDWYAHISPGTADMDSLDVRLACAELITKFSLACIIVTLGPRGAVHYGADGEVTASGPADVPRMVDTVGAGDAFSAVYLYGSAQGWPLALTMARANAFAGGICGIAGAVPQDTAFYQPWLARWHSAA
ncbi:fructokinase [Massilia sp. Root351]|jgi:fructokinase|uniref:PfkB family carbohydrate kinase n=1 Tax=Massilia sp. Root351 TaxID=1736522 RepID=UPI000709ABA8|nr:PfkB family carbohydrate kinase [Massilia sp. Root351]KQV90620.1 fructokinase [Massilia sp. Root351]